MTKASTIYPIEPPQCSAQREGKYANDGPLTDKQCSFRARYEIDGHKLCLQHAQVAALAILLMKEN